MTLVLGKLILKSALLQKSASDLALGAAGVALAGGSVAFAGYMIAQNHGGSPRVNGTEHLAIFGQPVKQPYTGGMTRIEITEQKLDMLPVGSVRARPNAERPKAQEPEKIAADYRIRGLSQGAALVQGPAGFITVRPGSVIDGLGDVIAIESRGRSLAVITTGGVILGD